MTSILLKAKISKLVVNHTSQKCYRVMDELIQVINLLLHLRDMMRNITMIFTKVWDRNLLRIRQYFKRKLDLSFNKVYVNYGLLLYHAGQRSYMQSSNWFNFQRSQARYTILHSNRYVDTYVTHWIMVSITGGHTSLETVHYYHGLPYPLTIMMYLKSHKNHFTIHIHLLMLNGQAVLILKIQSQAWI